MYVSEYFWYAIFIVGIAAIVCVPVALVIASIGSGQIEKKLEKLEWFFTEFKFLLLALGSVLYMCLYGWVKYDHRMERESRVHAELEQKAELVEYLTPHAEVLPEGARAVFDRMKDRTERGLR